MNNRKLQFKDIKLAQRDQQTASSGKVVSKNDIAIIGMGGRFPMAANPDEFWQLLRNGVDCVRTFPESRRRDIDKYVKYSGLIKGKVKYSEFGFLDEIDKFDHRFFNIPLNEARVIDPNQRIFLETAWQAIEDAGYGCGKIMGTRTGVYVGYKSALSNVYQKYISDTKPNLISLAMFGNKPHILAGRVSYFLNLKGPSMLIDTACSSSLISLHLACQSLRNGQSEMALVGSIKLMAVPIDGIDEKLGIESPDFRTRSFDDRSLGTGPGEGSAVILIKPLYKALDDRDHIYAVIKGSASNQDGRSTALAVPNANAQADVICRAWQDAGINPETVSYIETHGAGTTVGDPIEIDGLTKAFRKYTDKSQFCAIGAVKSNTGHLDNAATIAGLVKVILSLKNKELPPTAHFERPNRTIRFIQSPVYVNNELKPWPAGEAPRRCGVTGIGLNGTNCHVVLEEPAPQPPREPYTGYDIFTLSARSAPALKVFIKLYKKFITSNPGADAGDICFTNNTGKAHYEHRLAFVFRGNEDFRNKLCHLNNLKLEANNTGENIHYRSHAGIDLQSGGFVPGTIEQDTAQETSRAAEILENIQTNADFQARLNELCMLYVNGADIDWDLLYRNRECFRIATPTYPFEKIRCWVEVPEKRKTMPGLNTISELLSCEQLPEELTGELKAVLEKCRAYLEDSPPETELRELTGKEGAYTPLEKKIASIWNDFMGLDEIDIHRNFFRSGGDSVMALKITKAMRESLNIELKVIEFVHNPTIAALAALIEGKQKPQPVQS